MEFEEKSILEKFSGNLPVTIATSALGALVAGIPGALLPVLTNSLAHQRYVARVENALNQILIEIDSHRDRFNKINDAQYKILNETITTLYQTVDESKIEFLKKAVRNILHKEGITLDESTNISRIIRDISTQEAQFIANSSFEENQFKKIIILNKEPAKSKPGPPGSKVSATLVVQFGIREYVSENTLYVDKESKISLMVNNLVFLGLMWQTGTNEKGDIYEYSPITKKIVELFS